jgi:plastocyanin
MGKTLFRRLTVKLTVIVASLALVAVVAHADSGSSQAANVTVNVGNFWFCNSSFQNGVCPTTVKVADTVTWNWVVSFPHNTTSCTDATFSNCNGQNWASPTQSSGTFVHQFNSTGTFYYQCTVHPTQMRGRIDVIQDSDDDGWSDAAETAIGTNPALKCGTNAWPADINNDTFSDISDIIFLTNNFGAAAPPAPVRYNIAPDPPDAFIDITDISRLTGLFGQRCS